MQETGNHQNITSENLLVELRGIRLALEASVDMQKDLTRMIERTNKWARVFNFVVFFIIGLAAAYLIVPA